MFQSRSEFLLSILGLAWVRREHISGFILGSLITTAIFVIGSCY